MAGILGGQDTLGCSSAFPSTSDHDLSLTSFPVNVSLILVQGCVTSHPNYDSKSVSESIARPPPPSRWLVPALCWFAPIVSSVKYLLPETSLAPSGVPRNALVCRMGLW